MAMILEGITLFGFLQVTERGLVQVPDPTRFMSTFTLAGVLGLILTFVFSYRMSRSSYSPTLHQKRSPILIGAGYIILGLFATTAAYVTNSVLFGHILVPNQQEMVFGASIGTMFGFFILLYFDRYEFEPPDTRNELESLINNLIEDRQKIEHSSKSPIRLTHLYQSLTESVEEAAKILKESPTNDSKALALEMEEWVQTFRNKPEVSQAAIVEPSRSADDKELKRLRQQFDSIIERLGRISNNG